MNSSPLRMECSKKIPFTQYFYVALFLCGALAIVTFQGCSTGPDNLADYLPESGSITPWKAAGEPKIYKANELYDYINGGADIFYEYGFNQVIAQIYNLDNTSITVDIYEMNHPRAAFGIYSVQRISEMPALEIGDDGTASDYMVSFCQERFYVVITGNKPSEVVNNASVQIARAVSHKIQKSSPLPDLVKMLPSSHLIPGSRGYVSGLLGLNTQFYLGDSNILGINGSTVECVFAQYKLEEDQALLLIIRYPDSAAANAALNTVRETFVEKYQTVTVEDVSAYSDKRNRFYHLAAGNNFIYIIGRSDSVYLIKEIKSSINPSTSEI